MLTAKNSKREFTIYGLREFFIKTPWLGEAYAYIENNLKYPKIIDAWSSDDHSTINVFIGRWRLVYSKPSWWMRRVNQSQH